jgi:glyoxylase-like metal-dependent hydrolase (beta-lactamase superfamily II)
MKSIVMGILVIGLALMGTMSVADQGGQSMKTLGKVTVIKRDKATIHSYMAPEDSALVTSQIIETKNNLVVVDAQFLRPYAKDLYNYIKSLNKPVERIVITHSHPDHWFGLEYFQDFPGPGRYDHREQETCAR